MTKPRSDWDVAARKEHRALEQTNSKAAGAFAVEVNEGLNQAIRNQKEKALQEWVSQSGTHGAVGWAGARGLNQMSPLDALNRSLERAAIGENRTYPELSATDIKGIIDDTNAGNIEERFGKLGGLAYSGASWAADSFLTKQLLGQELIPLGEGKMQTKIIKPKEKTSRSIKTKDVANVLKVADKVGEAVAGSKEWFEEKKDSIDELAETYKEKGMSESKARYRATRDLLEDSYKKANGRVR